MNETTAPRAGARAEQTRARRLGTTAAALAVTGGLLWIPYGVFEFIQPWGEDVKYDEERAYDVVVDRGLFTLYSAPGALALVMTALAALALITLWRLPEYRWGRAARVAAVGAVGLGVVATTGVAVGFDPASTGGRILGSVVLGISLTTAAAAVRHSGSTPVDARALVGLGAFAVGMMLLWPLVYAVQVLPAAAAAVVIGVFGVLWVRLGLGLSHGRSHAER